MKTQALSSIRIAALGIALGCSSLAVAGSGQPESLAPGVSELGHAPLELTRHNAERVAVSAMACSLEHAIRRQDLRVGAQASNEAEALFLRYNARAELPNFNTPLGNQVIAAAH